MSKMQWPMHGPPATVLPYTQKPLELTCTTAAEKCRRVCPSGGQRVPFGLCWSFSLLALAMCTQATGSLRSGLA